jgi:hypothetical protein
MLAHVEAYIDFEADETTDITPEVFVQLYRDADVLIDKVEKFLK